MLLNSQLKGKKKYILLFLLIMMVCIISILGYVRGQSIIPCSSNSSFTPASDLSSGFSFIMQKKEANPQLEDLLSVIPSYAHCLAIERADLDEQFAGFAVFYPKSTLKQIHIFVDFLYQPDNPVLLGYILVGKLARANDYIRVHSGMHSLSCSDQNIHEGQAQLAYLVSLTPSEKDMLHHYILNEFYNYKDLITKKILKEQLNQISRCSLQPGACTQIIINFPKFNNEAIDSDAQCFNVNG